MFKTAFLLVVLALAPAAWADGEGQSKVKIDEVTGTTNKVSGDIDQEIVNAKLRADSGSKSKFSLSIKGSYTGGSIDNPFGTLRPRLSADPSVQSFTSLDTGLSARYRWSKNDSLTAGTSFGFVTPFQGRVTKNDAVSVADPNVAYNRVEKFWGLQSVSTFAYAYGTSIPSVDTDMTHQIGISYNVMKAFAGNRFSIGSSLGFGYSLFSSKPGENVSAHSALYGGDSRVQWSLAIYPTAEYAFTDKLSARTVFGYFNWRHLYGDPNASRLLQTYVYQSIGVGWSVTRDVYLYPNIQFVPDNIRSDFTNVALSTTINIF